MALKRLCAGAQGFSAHILCVGCADKYTESVQGMPPRIAQFSRGVKIRTTPRCRKRSCALCCGLRIPGSAQSEAGFKHKAWARARLVAADAVRVQRCPGRRRSTMLGSNTLGGIWFSWSRALHHGVSLQCCGWKLHDSLFPSRVLFSFLQFSLLGPTQQVQNNNET